MADKNRYPQIPSTVWWGLRTILQRTPNATVDERFLGVHLGVQEAAARQYITELKSVGILTEDNKASTLAQKWRLDESYAGAVEELIAATYPEGLIDVAPPGEADRQKIVSWFLREGLGQGSAGNKAATYLLLSSPTPNEAPARSNARSVADDNGKRKNSATKPAAGKPPTVSQNRAASEASLGEAKQKSRNNSDNLANFPLNINVQIHISADAGSEQIETIFKAMKRYLHDTSSN
ncbi:DUF5343 domain-containing protein [Bosea sp. LjRoot90]|uniref:hypothetical protein n=1 Tax=Bosea sp. LjRoot90 TaxID=3342342 RepID=UPI003ED150BE